MNRLNIQRAISNASRLAIAAALAAATLTTTAAHAQTLFLTSGITTIDNIIYQSGEVRVGQNSGFQQSDSNGVPYVATLNVVNGGSVGFAVNFNTSTVNISGGSVSDARSFNSSTTNISGGSVGEASTNSNSTTNISGGSVGNAFGSNTSTTNISGGSVSDARSFGTSTTNISGGSVGNARGVNTSTTNISGGILTNGFFLEEPTATVNFVGTGLSFAYQSYGDNNPYSTFADFFQISGTIGGAARTYDLYIRNAVGKNEATTPNSAPRQFTFNGAAPVNPVIVPEAGTLALLLPALGILGVSVAVLRRKGVVKIKRITRAVH